MKVEERVRPIEILLIEDNEGDVRLTMEALKEGRVLNHMTVAKDGEHGDDHFAAAREVRLGRPPGHHPARPESSEERRA